MTNSHEFIGILLVQKIPLAQNKYNLKNRQVRVNVKKRKTERGHDSDIPHRMLKAGFSEQIRNILSCLLPPLPLSHPSLPSQIALNSSSLNRRHRPDALAGTGSQPEIQIHELISTTVRARLLCPLDLSCKRGL